MGNYLREPKDSKAGFTQVWIGKPTAFISVIKQWAAISEKLMQVDSAADTGLITLWIANEHIDWRRYRSSGEYQLANTNNLRASVSQIEDNRDIIKPINQASDYRQG